MSRFKIPMPILKMTAPPAPIESVQPGKGYFKVAETPAGLEMVTRKSGRRFFFKACSARFLVNVYVFGKPKVLRI